MLLHKKVTCAAVSISVFTSQRLDIINTYSRWRHCRSNWTATAAAPPVLETSALWWSGENLSGLTDHMNLGEVVDGKYGRWWCWGCEKMGGREVKTGVNSSTVQCIALSMGEPRYYLTVRALKARSKKSRLTVFEYCPDLVLKVFANKF